MPVETVYQEQYRELCLRIGTRVCSKFEKGQFTTVAIAHYTVVSKTYVFILSARDTKRKKASSMQRWELLATEE